MLESNAGRRILNILFKVAVGTLVLLAIVACNSSDEDLATSPTPPHGYVLHTAHNGTSHQG